MAEVTSTRQSENIVLQIRSSENLHGENIYTSVKVEFGEKQVGESPKCVSEKRKTEYNYSTNITCPLDDPSFLNELGSRPILFTITEFLPKEKKQKDEKSQLLGQSVLDLKAFLKGSEKEMYSLPIHPYPGSPLEAAASDPNQLPTLMVHVSVTRSIIPESQMKQSNLLSLTIESLYNLPEAFSLSSAPGVYAVALPIPLAEDKEQTQVLCGGTVRAANEKESQNKQKRWCQPGNANGNATYIPSSFIPVQPFDEEDGELKGKENRENRLAAELEKPRVVWNQEKRCFLSPGSLKSFQEKIAHTHIWPVEVFRLVTSAAVKGKKDAEESYSHHGVAYVNLSPLLYPGVNRVRGAYPVYPYIDTEYTEKTNRKSALVEEAHKVAHSILNRNSNLTTGKKGAPASGPDKGAAAAPDKKEKGGDKKGKGAASENEAAGKGPNDPQGAANAEGQPGAVGGGAGATQIVNVEGQQYVEAQSYITLEFVLEKPLIPRRTVEDVAGDVKDLISPRPMLGKRTNHAQKAVEDYRKQVAEIAGHLLQEFRTLFAEEIRKGEIPSTPEAVEQMRQELMYELNKSGKYFAFKERLKYSVVKIVREKCLRTSSFADQEQLQMFLRDLFVFLVDELQHGLAQVITLQDRTPVPPPMTDSQQLLHFAKEAEWNENADLAVHYHQERIARHTDPVGDPTAAAQAWVDYGVHCLGAQGDLTKAEECFREAVSIDQKHEDALLLYAITCSVQDRKEEAETFFEAVTAYKPTSLVAWTIMGLHYHTLGVEIHSERAFQEAKRLNIAAARQAKLELDGVQDGQNDTKTLLAQAGQEATGSQPMDSSVQPNVNGSILSGEDALTETALGAAPTPGVSDSRRNSITQKLSTAKPPSVTSQTQPAGRRSVQSIQPAKVSSQEETNTILPHVKPSEPTDSGADEAVIKRRDGPPEPPRSIFIQAAQYLLQKKSMVYLERAMAHELIHLNRKNAPLNAEYHHCYGGLRMLQKDYSAAEFSLMEALPLAPADANIWADLGHLKYLVGDFIAARECYERCMAFVDEPREIHPVLMRLASIYLQETRYEEAKRTFLIACKRNPSCITWLGVGIACYRLDDLAQAEDALSEANILNNKDPEVWAYLSLICLRSGRKIEAEQSYKYAVKVGLSDPLLMEELHKMQKEVGFGNPGLSP